MWLAVKGRKYQPYKLCGYITAARVYMKCEFNALLWFSEC